jgi:hypothetical protein
MRHFDYHILQSRSWLYSALHTAASAGTVSASGHLAQNLVITVRGEGNLIPKGSQGIDDVQSWSI